jgi:hypothetical protein
MHTCTHAHASRPEDGDSPGERPGLDDGHQLLPAAATPAAVANTRAAHAVRVQELLEPAAVAVIWAAVTVTVAVPVAAVAAVAAVPAVPVPVPVKVLGEVTALRRGYAGMMVCWYAAMMLCWYAGMLVCWYAGMLVWYYGMMV